MISQGYIVGAFYAAIILLLYYYRDRFEFEGVVAMYRTKWGLRLMDRLASASPRLLRAFSITGIFTGYLVMAGMLWIVWIGIQNLLYRPDAPAAFVPLLPGVSVPGSPIHPPLIQTLLSIFIVVVIHEFAHGVIARLYDIDVKSSGFVLLGPIPGAFVEPEEDELEEASQETSQGLFAAGPYSNILFAIPVFFLVMAGIGMADTAYDGAGVEVAGFVNASNESGRLGSLAKGDVITGVNRTTVTSRHDLTGLLEGFEPNQTVSVTTQSGSTNVVLDAPPGGQNAGYMGIQAQTTLQRTDTWQAGMIESVKPAYFWFFGDFRRSIERLPSAYLWPALLNVQSGSEIGLLGWIFIVTTGIAGANLLPIGPLDGGRMWYKSLRGLFSDTVANSVASVTTWALFIVVLALLFVPMGRAIF